MPDRVVPFLGAASIKGSDLIVSKRVAVLKIEPELQNDFCMEKITIGTDPFTDSIDGKF